MIESEWIDCVQVIRACWPHADLPDNTIAAWRGAVVDLPVEQVRVAIETYYRDGREYPPNGGQLRRRVVELATDAPSWGEVWKHLRRAQRKAPHFRDDPDGRRPYLVANNIEVAADFMDAISWPTPEEWGDPNLESRVRRKWDEWLTDHLGGATYRGLPTAGLARLERGDGPRKLPASAIADAVAPERSLPPGPAGGASPTARYGLTVYQGGAGGGSVGGRGPTI